MRWRRFFSHPSAVLALVGLMAVGALSLTAELWANSKPIMMRINGTTYFPVLRDRHPSEFGQDGVVTDYRLLAPRMDSAVWPLIRWNPYEANPRVERVPGPPSGENWLGTDDRGRDILTRLLYGFRVSMTYALCTWLLGYLIGTALGAWFGYFGGRTDLIGSRVVEIWEMTPRLLMLITLVSIFTPNLFWLVLFTVYFEWTFIFHHVRAQFLQLRKRDYVEAARAIGVRRRAIIFKHILPNALTPLVTFSPFAIAANISYLTVLDYLGLGLPAPTASWGEMIDQAQKHIGTSDWLVWAPALALTLTMTALITVGLAVRDAFDANAS